MVALCLLVLIVKQRKRLDKLVPASLATFRSHLAIVESERAERQRAVLEADMARQPDPFAPNPKDAA
jgi:hypothetical protein